MDDLYVGANALNNIQFTLKLKYKKVRNTKK